MSGINLLKKQRSPLSDRMFDLTVNGILLIVLLIVLYPLYFVVLASISDPNAVNSGQTLLIPRGVSLISYEKIFDDRRIWTGYRNTAVYAVCGTLFGLIVTLLAGYSLSRRDMVGRLVIMKFLVFTMFFSGGLIPTYMVVRGLNLVNTPFVMIILGSVSVFNIIIARTFFQATIPNELLEAAFIDGCSNSRFFISFVIPISKAIIAVIALYYAVFHWNSFFNGLIYLNSQNLYPLQLVLRDILIQNQMMQSDNVDPDSVAAMLRLAATIKYGVIIVSSLPVLIAYPFLQKYFVMGIMIGSIKG